MLASYDGGKITEHEFRQAITNLPERVREAALIQKEDFLDSLVIEKLLLQEAESRGLQHSAEVEAVLSQARQRILVAKLIEDEVELKADVDADEVKTYYDNHRDEFVTPFRLRASHILLRSREEADEMLQRLQEGESFEDLAKEHSLDPSAVKGGDVGYFKKGQLIPEFEEVAFSLKKDDLSDIVQSPFGFHIIKVTGEAKPQVKDFAVVEKDITSRLLIEKKTENFESLVERLKKKAGIKINEEAIEAFKLEDEAPSLES